MVEKHLCKAFIEHIFLLDYIIKDDKQWFDLPASRNQIKAWKENISPYRYFQKGCLKLSNNTCNHSEPSTSVEVP